MPSPPSTLPQKRPFPTLSTAQPSRPLRPILSRKRTRTQTGTRTRTRTGTRNLTAHQDDLFIVSLIDNSAKEVGFCAYNLRGFDVELRQFPDSNTFLTLLTALCVFQPVEILMSVSSAGGLLDQAVQRCPYLENVKRTFIGRTYFNETYGALAVENLSNVRCPNLQNLGESSCYLALACCGALIRYVEHVDEIIFAPASLRIRYRPNETAIFLDMSTLEGLEVVANARQTVGVGNIAGGACLLRAMDKTKTRAGKRFLRRSLIEPSADRVTIATRQDTVDELSNSEQLYFGVIAILASFPDLEAAAASLMARENARLRTLGVSQLGQLEGETVGEDGTDSEEMDEAVDARKAQSVLPSALPPSIALVHNVLVIKAALQKVAPLLEAIQGSTSPLMRALAESMRNGALSRLLKEIDDVVDPQALPVRESEKMRMQGAFAVQSGRNGRLDVSRKTLSENIDDMQELLEEIRTKYGYPKVSLCLHVRRGYHFAVNRKFLDVKDFPNEFIQVEEGNKLHRFMTEELSQLNNRYHDSLQEIWRLSEIELGSLLNIIFKPEVLTALHRLCDSIAILDTLTSFVTYASYNEAPMQRPKLTEGGPIALQKAYHPILLEIKPHKVVPNDVFLDETSAVHIISGRNQSGKSDFIRMVGLICIMAHTGCMVPAKFASVRILKRMSSRLSMGDDVTQNQSHFSREMQDLAIIINGIREVGSGQDGRVTRVSPPSGTSSTLVLIDELGRSTSTLDGFSIAFAAAEYLSKCPCVLTLFATHFLGLGVLASCNPIISAFHLRTEPIPDEHQKIEADEEPDTTVKFTYTIANGILHDSSYGIDTAKAAGCSEEILRDALELRKQVPVRRISHASKLAEAHLNHTGAQKRALQKATSVISVAQQKSLIETSTSDPDKLSRLLHGLQVKVKHAQERSRSKRGPQSSSRASDATVPEITADENIGGSNIAKS